jgi:hypothetical protein
MKVVLTKMGHANRLDSDKDDYKIEEVDKMLLFALHKRYDITALKKLMDQKIFVHQAARDVAIFIEICKKENSDSDDESNIDFDAFTDSDYE